MRKSSAEGSEPLQAAARRQSCSYDRADQGGPSSSLSLVSQSLQPHCTCGAAARAEQCQQGTQVLADVQERKAAPLQRGGSLTGKEAAGKVHVLLPLCQPCPASAADAAVLVQDAGKAAASNVLEGQQVGPVLQVQDGKFTDYRWKEGRWDLSLFENRQTNQMDWASWNSVRCPCWHRWLAWSPGHDSHISAHDAPMMPSAAGQCAPVWARPAADSASV